MLILAALLFFILFSYGIFFAALVGLIAPWSLWVLLVAAGSSALWLAQTQKLSGGVSWGQAKPYILIASFAAFWLLLLRVPVFQVDDIAYHLFVPRQIFRTGQMYLSTDHINTNMPMLFEMPFVFLSEYLGVSPFVANIAAAFLLGSSFYYWGRRYFDLQERILLPCVLALLTVPVVTQLVLSAYVELFMTLTVLWGYMYFAEFKQSAKERHWLAACAFLGCAISVKYTGLILAFPLMAYEYLKHGSRRSYCLGAGLLLLVPSPWLVKNLIYIGNPVYPLLPWFFESRGLSVDRFVRYESVMRSYHYGRDLLSYVLLPVRLLTGLKGEPTLGQLGFGGTLSVFFALSLAGLGRRSAARLVISVGFLFFFGTWAIYSQQVRFLLPILTVTALFGLKAVTDQPRFRQYLPAFVSLVLLQNVYFTFDYLASNKITDLLAGRSTVEQFHEHHTPSSVSLARRINAEIGSRDVVMLTVGNFGRNYFFDMPTVAHTYYETEMFDNAFAAGQVDPSILVQYLKDLKITHIYINWYFFNKLMPTPDVVDRDAMLKFIIEKTDVVFEADEIKVHRLRF